jgi:hypothetical protein
MLSISTYDFPNTLKDIFLESGKWEQASNLLTAKTAPGYKGWEVKCVLETTSGHVLCLIYQSVVIGIEN